MKCLAMYLRLSIEESVVTKKEIPNGESNSIRSQRKQIYEYIRSNAQLRQYKVVEFCDDGYSGTNMNRPAMKDMLQAMKEKKIHCIIVKDMSRFSRDYIEMGTYLNQIFPLEEIRFIAINDHYDSLEYQEKNIEIDTVFRTLLYDLYSKDISVKVKAAFESKCAKGEYIFGQVPFGYEKCKAVKNAIVVNQEEAKIVRYIFSLALQGKSSSQIAKQLDKEGIPTITKMRRAGDEVIDGKVLCWNGNSIRRILKNRFYLGEMVYGKTKRKYVGSKTGIAKPRETWKVIKNHHEAIITEEVFEAIT